MLLTVLARLIDLACVRFESHTRTECLSHHKMSKLPRAFQLVKRGDAVRTGHQWLQDQSRPMLKRAPDLFDSCIK